MAREKNSRNDEFISASRAMNRVPAKLVLWGVVGKTARFVS